jgi:hypothetical protein
MRIRQLLLPTLLLPLGGCAVALLAQGCTGDTGAPGEVGLRAELREPEPFQVAVEDCRVGIDEAELTLTGGEILLGAPRGEVLSVEGLELRFADVVIEDRMPLDGLRLTNVVVSLPQPIDVVAEWSAAGDAAFAEAEAELQLDWSLVTWSGQIVALAPQHARGVRLTMHVFRAEDGSLVAELVGGSDGVIFNWADVATISDLRLDVRATR